MKVTYQYPIKGLDTTLMLPEGAQPLHVEIQDGITTLWALVDTEEPMQARRFEVFPTGMEMPQFAYNYINTFISRGFTFHAFERL